MPEIHNVMLLSSFFVDFGKGCDDKINYDLTLTMFKREDIINVEGQGSTLSFRVIFNLFYEEESPPFRLMCGYLITYQAKDTKEFELLHDHVVLAHIIPYVREHISGITVKSRFSALYLPTVNTLDLLDKYHKSDSKSPSLNQ